LHKVFVWNQWNVEHIGNHGVTPQEAEFVVEQATGRYPQKIGDAKYLVWGRTADRRPIQVIFIRLASEQVDIELLDILDRLTLEEGDE
jgi:hypothetical protein